MEFIIPEVLVTIADHADSHGIFALMLTCSRFAQILKHYERSVVQGKFEAYCRSAVDPKVLESPTTRNVSTHPVLQLSRGKDAAVLTSHSPKRTVARPYSYAVVRELEVREARIKRLLDDDSSSFSTSVTELLDWARRNSLSAEGPRLTPRDLRENLKRACRLADLVGDCVARIVARADWIDGYNAHLEDAHYCPRNHCRCNCWVSNLTNFPRDGGAVSRRHHLDIMPGMPPEEESPASDTRPPCTVREKMNRDKVMNKLAHVVRTAQSSLISRLPAQDQISLAMLSELAGGAYYLSTPKGMHESDPEHIEKRVAFQECVLRRGASLSIWALGLDSRAAGMPCPLPSFKSQVDDGIRAVLWELFLWEMGYGNDRVLIRDVFKPVCDTYLQGLVRDFDRAVEGEKEMVCSGDEDVGEEDDAKTVPAMQRGLHATMVRSLNCKTDLAGLTVEEKVFAEAMQPPSV